MKSGRHFANGYDAIPGGENVSGLRARDYRGKSRGEVTSHM